MSILSRVTTEAPRRPSRVVLYTAEKWGKTSFAAHAPGAIGLMTAGEDGLLTLKSKGLVPQTVAHLPEDTRQWAELVETVRALIHERHDHRTAFLDTGNGAERLLAESVCHEEFGGNWSEFNSYASGEKNCVPHWSGFLGLLDQLRTKRGMSVIILHHSTVKTVNNPTGKDWDQHRPEGMKNLWGLTHKWADAILYGGWKVDVKKVERGGDEKAVGETRFIQCGNCSAIVAGNRYGLPAEIFPKAPGAKAMWDAFANAMGANSAPPSGVNPDRVVQPGPNGRNSTLPRTGAGQALPVTAPTTDDEIPFGQDAA